MAYKLTARRGPRVDRSKFDELDDAVAALEREADVVRLEGPLDAAKMFREFEPGERVAARLEISTGGLLGGKAAGVDVMGDGELVPFVGGVGRRPLEVETGESAFDAVRRALERR